MFIPNIISIKPIERQYSTGEEPVLVLCSDMNSYICKYMRSSVSSYKLTCELVGGLMAKAWGIHTPDIAFVRIKPEHWAGVRTTHSVSVPTLGGRRLEGVIDITPSTYHEIEPTKALLEQLVKIALFDFWIANEDRNANNANLLYDINMKRLVSIDYGCILNTATFDYPMSQLTSTDTILWSDLFQHLFFGGRSLNIKNNMAYILEYYEASLQRSLDKQKELLDALPQAWNVQKDVLAEKLRQLFDKNWIAGVWENFVENLKENSYGKS